MPDLQASLDEAMQIDGALGAALVDSRTGTALAVSGQPEGLDLHVAAAGNSAVVRAKLATLEQLGLNQQIEDILITLNDQHHVIRTLSRQPHVFLYLVLDRAHSNLAMARFRLTAIESRLEV